MRSQFVPPVRRNIARRRCRSIDRDLAPPAETVCRRRLHARGGEHRACAAHCVRILRLLAESALANRGGSFIRCGSAGFGVRGSRARFRRPASVRCQEPVLAAVLSVLIIGLGHWYLGRWRRALAWEGGLFALAIAFTAMNLPDSALSTVGLALLVASGADAWRIATQMNAAPSDGKPANRINNPATREPMFSDSGYRSATK